jgi:hypothetical protein
MPYTKDEVAQAITVVTHFDKMLHHHGPAEAMELRDTAWSILRADAAARRAARHAEMKVRWFTPGDAA